MKISDGPDLLWRRHPILLVALCCFAVIKFTLRGPVRAVGNSGDFRTIYTASRAFTKGLDCYDPDAVSKTWNEIDPHGHYSLRPELHALYPPTTYLVLSPLALLPWRVAQAAWCAINIAALFAIAICLGIVAKITPMTAPSAMLIAVVLALEPASTAVMLGQTSLVVAALAAASLLLVCKRRLLTGGVLEGLAIAIKPQLACVVLLAYALNRRWRAFAVATIVVGALFLTAWMPLRSDPQWFQNYLSDLSFEFGGAGKIRFSASNAFVVQLINLRFPFSVLLGNDVGSMYFSAAIAILLAVAPALYLMRNANPDLLLYIALLLLAELMFSYHRSYDAIVVSFAIAWSMSPRVTRRRAFPIWIGAALFMTPSGVGVKALGDAAWFPHSIASGIVWNAFIVPYQAWTVLALGIWMTYCVMSAGTTVGPAS